MKGHGFAMTLMVPGAVVPDGVVRHYYCTPGFARFLLYLMLFNVYVKLITGRGYPEVFWNAVPSTIMELVQG